MKKTKRRKNTLDSTPTAVAIAALVAVAAIQAAEIIYGNVRNAGASDSPQTPMWRVHMGSACAGTVAFVIALFFLETLGRKSKVMALRSAVPWSPMVALTGLATAVHIPMYVVILIAAIYSPWAYFRTRAVH